MIAAVVVGFFPDFPVLNTLLLKLLDQVDYLIFVDNGGGRDFLHDQLDARKKVEYVDLQGNKGLGFALNTGFALAAARGCSHIATFDQDSAPPDGMIQGLLQTHLALERQGIDCAAVSPAFYDRRQGEIVRFPFYREVDGAISIVATNTGTSDVTEVDVLITSGMLVKTAVWANGIQYNAGLFVDYTDTDWCFRARAAGHKLFASLQQEMGHALSDAPPVRLFGLNFFIYSPLRRYYYFRNTILFVRQTYVSKAWKKRLMIGLLIRFVSSLLTDQKKFASLKMMSKGIYQGLHGQDGAYK